MLSLITDRKGTVLAIDEVMEHVTVDRGALIKVWLYGRVAKEKMG